MIKNRVNGVDDFTKFETKNVGSPKHDTAVNTNSGNNKPPCLTVVATNENKTGITDRNTRTNDQPQNQTSIVNVTVSPGQKLNRQKNITPITVSAEKNSCVNTGTAILNTSEYNTQF